MQIPIFFVHRCSKLCYNLFTIKGKNKKYGSKSCFSWILMVPWSSTAELSSNQRAGYSESERTRYFCRFGHRKRSLFRSIFHERFGFGFCSYSIMASIYFQRKRLVSATPTTSLVFEKSLIKPKSIKRKFFEQKQIWLAVILCALA